MIAIVDYEAGNILSVENALRRLGAAFEVTADPAHLRAATPCWHLATACT